MLALAPPSQDPDGRIAAVLAAGCRNGCDGLVQLVRFPIAGSGGGWQIRLQCTVCGDRLGSALPRALYPDWRNLPEFDPAIEERYREARGMNTLFAPLFPADYTMPDVGLIDVLKHHGELYVLSRMATLRAATLNVVKAYEGRTRNCPSIGVLLDELAQHGVEMVLEPDGKVKLVSGVPQLTIALRKRQPPPPPVQPALSSQQLIDRHVRGRIVNTGSSCLGCQQAFCHGDKITSIQGNGGVVGRFHDGCYPQWLAKMEEIARRALNISVETQQS